MDHWHAESLLIRIISIFCRISGIFSLFSWSAAAWVVHPSASFPSDSAPCSLPPNRHSLSAARPPSPQLSFPTMKQENTGGGGRRAILTRSSSSPRGFTLYYLCVLHLDRVFAARSSPSIVPSRLVTVCIHANVCRFSRLTVKVSRLPSSWPSPETSAIFNPLPPSERRWKVMDVASTSSDYSWYLTE